MTAAAARMAKVATKSRGWRSLNLNTPGHRYLLQHGFQRRPYVPGRVHGYVRPLNRFNLALHSTIDGRRRLRRVLRIAPTGAGGQTAQGDGLRRLRADDYEARAGPPGDVVERPAVLFLQARRVQDGADTAGEEPLQKGVDGREQAGALAGGVGWLGKKRPAQGVAVQVGQRVPAAQLTAEVGLAAAGQPADQDEERRRPRCGDIAQRRL